METSTDSIMVKLEELYPNPYQPPSRVEVSEDIARAFGESIFEHGLLQTPVVRCTDGRYEIGDGWLRRAGFAWLVGQGHQEYTTMPVILRGFTDQQMADLVIETNDRRRDLNPIERAWYYRKYLADFQSVTQSEFAWRRGVSQGEIANTIRLLDLPEKVQQMIISREISESHGRALLALKESDLMIEYALHTIDNGWSVAALDGVIRTYIDRHKPKLVEPEPPQEETITFDMRKCRVCGCTDSGACIDEKTGEPCHWVEEDLCSVCAKKESDEKQEAVLPGAAGVDMGEPEAAPGDETPESHVVLAEENKEPLKEPAQQSQKKSAEKPPEKPAASATTAAPEPVKPNWGRKLVIEEKTDHIMASCMKAGGIPRFNRIPDVSFQTAIQIAAEWVTQLEEQWSKEEQK